MATARVFIDGQAGTMAGRSRPPAGARRYRADLDEAQRKILPPGAMPCTRPTLPLCLPDGAARAMLAEAHRSVRSMPRPPIGRPTAAGFRSSGGASATR